MDLGWLRFLSCMYGDDGGVVLLSVRDGVGEKRLAAVVCSLACGSLLQYIPLGFGSHYYS